MKRLRVLMLSFCVVPLPGTAQNGPSALERIIDRAQEAQTKQDCATAATEYTKAVKLMPSSGELRTNQGIAFYCNNQFPEATAALYKALQLNSALPVPHLFLGLAAFHLADQATAVRELETAKQSMRDDVTVNLWLGYAYLESRNLDKAAHQFEQVLELQPRNVDASYALGQTYFQLGRKKALELAELAPGGRGIRELASQQHSMMGKPDASLEQTSQRQWASADEEKLYKEALDAETKARAALQSVLDEAPDSDRAHQIQGDAYSVQRENDAAIAEYTAILKINPKLPGVRLSLANCLMQVNRFKDALSVLTEEQGLQPRSADVWASTGRVQQALGKDAEALVSLRKSVSLPTPPPEARLLLGKALLRLNDAQAAIPQLEQALQEGADPSTANYLLARAYRTTGDRAGMQRALSEYHRTSRDQAEREAALGVTRDPQAVRMEMTAQDRKEANALSGKSE